MHPRLALERIVQRCRREGRRLLLKLGWGEIEVWRRQVKRGVKVEA